MKVREFIEYLQRLDPEKNIWLLDESGENFDIGYTDPTPDTVLTENGRKELIEDLQIARRHSMFPDLFPDTSDEIKVGDYLILCCCRSYGEKLEEPFIWQQSPYTAQARHLAKMDEEIHLAAQRGPRPE